MFHGVIVNYTVFDINWSILNHILSLTKNVMQGKLIAVEYTLRTLGGICKQEKIPQC